MAGHGWSGIIHHREVRKSDFRGPTGFGSVREEVTDVTFHFDGRGTRGTNLLGEVVYAAPYRWDGTHTYRQRDDGVLACDDRVPLSGRRDSSDLMRLTWDGTSPDTFHVSGLTLESTSAKVCGTTTSRVDPFPPPTITDQQAPYIAADTCVQQTLAQIGVEFRRSVAAEHAVVRVRYELHGNGNLIAPTVTTTIPVDVELCASPEYLAGVLASRFKIGGRAWNAMPVRAREKVLAGWAAATRAIASKTLNSGRLGRLLRTDPATESLLRGIVDMAIDEVVAAGVEFDIERIKRIPPICSTSWKGGARRADARVGLRLSRVAARHQRRCPLELAGGDLGQHHLWLSRHSPLYGCSMATMAPAHFSHAGSALVAGGCVERAERLVEDEHVGPLHQGPGEADPAVFLVESRHPPLPTGWSTPAGTRSTSDPRPTSSSTSRASASASAWQGGPAPAQAGCRPPRRREEPVASRC